MSLRIKSLIGFVGIVLAITIAIVSFNYLNYHRILRKQLLDKGISLAKTFVAQNLNALLYDDIIGFKNAMKKLKTSEEDVAYAFILNPHNEILCSTFDKGFPRQLYTIVTSEMNEHSPFLLKTEDGFIWNIHLPIMEGYLGSFHIGISENRIRGIIGNAIWQTLIIIGVIYGIGVLFILFFINRMADSLSELVRTIKMVGEGNFAARIEHNTDDELGDIAKNFNLMAMRLEKAYEELKNAQAQIMRTAKLVAVGNLATALVHEINNPLNGIMSCLNILKSKALTNREREKYLDLANEGLLRIQTITKRLLGLSRDRPLSLKPTDINQLVEKTLFFIDYRLKESGITLQRHFGDGLPQVMIDQEAILQVLINLLVNAIESMSPGGTLTINTSSNARWIKISITDTGEGIPPENLDRIFTPFFSTKQDKGGTGMGLAISLNIIEQHHGEIEIQSQVNKGSTFTIKLPINKNE